MKINDTLIDTITNYGITIKDNELYLIINGATIKLVDNNKYLNEREVI